MKHSKKCLTIHLYRRDEALASIRWAILSRNHTEAIFWGLELYDSNMEADTIQALASTWVSRIGFGSLRALETLQTLRTADRESWCEILMSWCRFKIHDTTIFHLLIRGGSTPTNWQPSFAHSNEYLTLEAAFEATLQRKKLMDAWLIARAIDPTVQWTILKRLTSKLGFQSHFNTIQTSPLSDIEKRATLCTLLMITPDMSDIPSGTLPLELRDATMVWDAEDSLRKRRVFTIRPEAITYLCERSGQPVSESNQQDIQDNLEQTLLASSYWKDILKTYKSKMEKFYDTFFSYKTHDIPDEWSIADREKSHGRGLGKSEEQAIKQFIHNTVQGSVTLGLWNSTSNTGML